MACQYQIKKKRMDKINCKLEILHKCIKANTSAIWQHNAAHTTNQSTHILTAQTKKTDRMAGKATITGGLRLGRSEVLRSLRHYLRAQSQGHHTIDRLEERGVLKRKRSTTFLERTEKGSSSIRTTLEMFQGQHWGNSWDTGWSANGPSRARR